jgi:hypothetical protein
MARLWKASAASMRPSERVGWAWTVRARLPRDRSTRIGYEGDFDDLNNRQVIENEGEWVSDQFSFIPNTLAKKRESGGAKPPISMADIDDNKRDSSLQPGEVQPFQWGGYMNFPRSPPLWRTPRDSNPEPPVLETGALPS